MFKCLSYLQNLILLKSVEYIKSYRYSMLNDDGMAAYGYLRIFMIQKVLGSLSEVSRDSIKPNHRRAGE